MRPLDDIALSAALRSCIEAHGGSFDERAANVHSLRELEIAITSYVTEAVHARAYYDCPLCGSENDGE